CHVVSMTRCGYTVKGYPPAWFVFTSLNTRCCVGSSALPRPTRRPRRSRCRTSKREVASLKLHADGLHLGVGLERLVAHLAAPSGLLVAPEGEGRIKDVVAVDP